MAKVFVVTYLPRMRSHAARTQQELAESTVFDVGTDRDELWSKTMDKVLEKAGSMEVLEDYNIVERDTSEGWKRTFRESVEALTDLEQQVFLSSLEHIDRMLVEKCGLANDDVIDMMSILKEIVK